MSIPEPVKTNFDTLLSAAANGDLALMECQDAKTGETRYVLTAVGFDGTEYLMTPFGHMVSDCNPFEAYLPPDPDNPEGFIRQESKP